MLQLSIGRARAVVLAAISALAMVWPTAGPARAGMVPTEAVIEATDFRSAERARVAAFVSRIEVRRHMEALGVDPEEAAARTESLSDEEVALIAGKLDVLPAGAEVVPVEIILAVLAVLLLIVILI